MKILALIILFCGVLFGQQSAPALSIGKTGPFPPEAPINALPCSDLVNVSSVYVQTNDPAILNSGPFICLQIDSPRKGAAAWKWMPFCINGLPGTCPGAAGSVTINTTNPLSGGGVVNLGGTLNLSCSGCGSVLSVGLTTPSWLTVGGSPVTSSGTLAITPTSGQPPNEVIGTCGTTSFQPVVCGVTINTAAPLGGGGLLNLGGTLNLTCATCAPPKRIAAYVFDGIGQPLSGTLDACVDVPYNATITKITLLSDLVGGATVDVRSVPYSSYTGPASASTIIGGGGTTPLLSASSKYQDTTLTSWSTSVTANTVICFHLTSPSTATWVMADLVGVAN